MVIPLRPSKFYGSSLPRPRFYTDVKFSDERVDPPVPVLDPLMSWAEEAHWSMGGLSFNRLRLQGKIEGNVKKLRKEREVSWGKKMEKLSPVSESKKKVGVRRGAGRVDSPPSAPISKKRRQRKFVEDEEEEFDDYESENEDEFEFESKMKVGGKKRRRLVRKLGDDFELVGDKSVANGETPLKDLSNGGGVSKGVAARTRSRRSMMVMDEEKDDDEEEEEVVVKKEMNVVENAKEVVNSKKKNGRKSNSVSPKTGSRSSPRLKK